SAYSSRSFASLRILRNTSASQRLCGEQQLSPCRSRGLGAERSYFWAVAPVAPITLAYLRRKRSTRPAVSTSFCLPVKNGWQAEQISTWMSPRWVERVPNTLPQAQWTRTSLYAG